MKAFLLLASLALGEPETPKVAVSDMREAMLTAYTDKVTKCVAEHVSASKNFGRQTLDVLITEEMKGCNAPARALVDFIDEWFGGKGVGEHFFKGYYRDTLLQRLEVWLKARGK